LYVYEVKHYQTKQTMLLLSELNSATMERITGNVCHFGQCFLWSSLVCYVFPGLRYGVLWYGMLCHGVSWYGTGMVYGSKGSSMKDVLAKTDFLDTPSHCPTSSVWKTPSPPPSTPKNVRTVLCLRNAKYMTAYVQSIHQGLQRRGLDLNV